MTNSIDELAKYIEDVPNFPKEGIIFKETTRLFKEKWPETIEAMKSLFTEEELQEVDAFVGLDARGFSLAGALAAVTGKGFITARKGDKLPDPLLREDYYREYDDKEKDAPIVIEMKKGTGNVIIIDDVLATGGTLMATSNLSLRAGYNVLAAGVAINLTFANDFEWNGMKARSVFDYQKDANGENDIYIPVADRPAP